MAGYQIVAAPAWGIADYLRQCAQDGSTKGAVIALQPSIGNGLDNYLIFNQGWTLLQLQAVVTKCDQKEAKQAKMTVSWISDVIEGRGARGNVPLLPLAAIVAALNALHPPFTTTTTVKRTVAAPSPLPPGASAVTEISTQGGQTVNTNAPLLVVGQAFASQSGGASVALGEAPDTEKSNGQMVKAAQRAVGGILDQLVRYCTNDASNKFCEWLKLP